MKRPVALEDLSEPQLIVLASISRVVQADEPFPPANTVRALMRRGLVETVDDPSDAFARMVGGWQLRVTETGKSLVDAAIARGLIFLSNAPGISGSC